MFKKRKFKSRKLTGFKLKSYYIKKDDQLTHEELVNNAIVALSVTKSYSYMHEQSGNLFISLMNRYTDQVKELDRKYLISLLYLKDELCPETIYRSFRSIIKKAEQRKAGSSFNFGFVKKLIRFPVIG